MPQGTKAERALEDIGGELAGRGAVKSQMFGMPTLKVGGKAFAGAWRGAMVFKLSPDDVQAALKLKGAELFDPGMGRPMKEWVMVPPAHAKRWSELASSSLAYVAATAAGKSKPKTTAESKRKPAKR